MNKCDDPAWITHEDRPFATDDRPECAEVGTECLAGPKIGKDRSIHADLLIPQCLTCQVDEHIFERWLDDVHIDQSRAVPADMLHDARDGRAAVLACILTSHSPLRPVGGSSDFRCPYALQLACQFIVPARHLQADDFLLVDAALESFGCIEGDDLALCR